MRNAGNDLDRELIAYIIVGVITTLVDYVVFAIVNELMQHNGIALTTAVTVATVVSWTAAVLFAYIANKFAVFRNRDVRPQHIAGELSSFVGARLMSGVITLILMYLMTSPLGINEYIAKIVTSVFNMIFNYVASKFFIFKK